MKALGPASGRYNCHGLVFASRRTNIDSPDIPVDVQMLLRWDRYRPIDPPPQVGDVAVYAAGNGRVEHTGFVSSVYPPSGSDKTRWKVWSKWGILPEYEHEEYATPYRDLSVSYWRLDP